MGSIHREAKNKWHRANCISFQVEGKCELWPFSSTFITMHNMTLGLTFPFNFIIGTGMNWWNTRICVAKPGESGMSWCAVSTSLYVHHNSPLVTFPNINSIFFHLLACSWKQVFCAVHKARYGILWSWIIFHVHLVCVAGCKCDQLHFHMNFWPLMPFSIRSAIDTQVSCLQWQDWQGLCLPHRVVDWDGRGSRTIESLERYNKKRAS